MLGSRDVSYNNRELLDHLSDALASNVAGCTQVRFSLQHGHYSNPTAPDLQHTAKQKQNDQCGNSTA